MSSKTKNLKISLKQADCNYNNYLYKPGIITDVDTDIELVYLNEGPDDKIVTSETFKVPTNEEVRLKLAYTRSKSTVSSHRDSIVIRDSDTKEILISFTHDPDSTKITSNYRDRFIVDPNKLSKMISIVDGGMSFKDKDTCILHLGDMNNEFFINNEDFGLYSLRYLIENVTSDAKIYFSELDKKDGIISLSELIKIDGKNNITIDGTLNDGISKGTILGDCLFAIYRSENILFKNIIFKNSINGANTVYPESSVTFDNCEFENNQKGYGGAITNYGQTIIKYCLFEENSATANDGGAIYSNGVISIENCKFKKNTANMKGGAVYLEDNIKNYPSEQVFCPEIGNCEFIDNKALYGGGVYYDSTDISLTKTLWLKYVKFVDNNAEKGGGYCYKTLKPRILNVSFDNNLVNDYEQDTVNSI